MTLLIDRIMKDATAARIAQLRDRATLLTTLHAEAARVGKDARNGPSTDEEVTAVIRKFLKNVEFTAEQLGKLEASRPNDYLKALLEIDILSSYLPQQMTSNELDAAIRRIVSNLYPDVPRGEIPAKAMGAVMQALKAAHDGTYDGKAASTAVKAILAE